MNELLLASEELDKVANWCEANYEKSLSLNQYNLRDDDEIFILGSESLKRTSDLLINALGAVAYNIGRVAQNLDSSLEELESSLEFLRQDTNDVERQIRLNEMKAFNTFGILSLNNKRVPLTNKPKMMLNDKLASVLLKQEFDRKPLDYSELDTVGTNKEKSDKAEKMMSRLSTNRNSSKTPLSKKTLKKTSFPSLPTHVSQYENRSSLLPDPIFDDSHRLSLLPTPSFETQLH